MINQRTYIEVTESHFSLFFFGDISLSLLNLLMFQNCSSSRRDRDHRSLCTTSRAPCCRHSPVQVIKYTEQMLIVSVVMRSVCSRYRRRNDLREKTSDFPRRKHDVLRHSLPHPERTKFSIDSKVHCEAAHPL